MEKKVYETPEVTKVEFDTSDRITATGCSSDFPEAAEYFLPSCLY